jgi:apolipoprotein N-acyltransferase
MSGITRTVAEFARIPASPPRVLANAATLPTPALAGAPPSVSSLLLFLVALPSALLLYLAYFPVSWGFVGWIALVPFLILVRARTDNFFRYFTAFVVALAFYWPALQWMRVADHLMYFAWGAVATACGMFYPLALFLIRFLDQRTRLPLVVSVPIVWTALEFLRSNICGGFGWYLLGHSQHDYLPMIQIADVTGAYGVSFLLAAFNALLVEMLFALAWFRQGFAPAEAPSRYSRLGLLGQALAVFVAVSATVAYGFWQLRDDSFRPGPRVALIQGNLDQRIRNDRKAGPEISNHYQALSQLASSEQYHADMIVWPETSFPYGWDIEADGAPCEDCRKIAKAFADDWKTFLLRRKRWAL